MWCQFLQYIYIDRSSELLRIVIKKDDLLRELFFKEAGEVYPGEIYKGVVKNIVPAIKCAFVDIGKDKNAYMYIDGRFKNNRLKKGDEVLVQISKDDIDRKGAKVVSSITVSGKYCVLDGFNKSIQFSRKIHDCDFKELICSKLKIPEDTGIMIRTSGQNVSPEIIQSEFNRLYQTYEEILKKSRYSSKPGLVFDDGGIIEKTLRDKLDEDNFKIYVNQSDDYDKIIKMLSLYDYNKDNVEFYRGSRNIFSYYDIEKEILKLRNKRVYLKCGGYIVIDRTEAMYVIDVNSGKNIKNKSMKNTVFTTNYEASEEIVRQIRLRNLSGIILIDFIDMDSIQNKNSIMDVLKKGFLDDKNKTVVYPFTELNLIQIARRRSGKSIDYYIDEDCSCCQGRGSRIKFSYISMNIKNEIEKMKTDGNIEHIHVEIGNAYRSDIEKDTYEFLKSIGALKKNIYLTYKESMCFHVEPLVFSNQIEKLKKYKI